MAHSKYENTIVTGPAKGPKQKVIGADIAKPGSDITHIIKNENTIVEQKFDLDNFVKGLSAEDLKKIKDRFFVKEDEAEFENIKKIKKNNKCCIVGFAMSWSDAPYEEKGIDFWGINELYLCLREKDIQTPFAAWFEIHNIKESPSKQKKIHQDFLKNCKIPLVTQKHWDEYPASIPYPRHYIKKYFNKNFVEDEKNTGFSDYSNQISWMIALAIALGYEEIMVYGVDMAQESEYAFQRASCQFFLGYAIGAGITVRIPKSCELLKAGADYGFRTDNKNRFRKKDRIKGCNDQMQRINTRGAEIEYYVNFLKEKLEKDKILAKADMKVIENELKEADIQKISAEMMLSFLSTIPDNLADIDKKKVKIMNTCTLNISGAEKLTKKLNGELKALEKTLEKKESACYINIKMLEDEQNMAQDSVKRLRGCIDECNHDLNNNLV